MQVVLEPVNGKGLKIPVDKAIIFIGRHPECDVVITRSRTISRKHCAIVQVNDSLVLARSGEYQRCAGQRQAREKRGPLHRRRHGDCSATSSTTSARSSWPNRKSVPIVTIRRTHEPGVPYRCARRLSRWPTTVKKCPSLFRKTKRYSKWKRRAGTPPIPWSRFPPSLGAPIPYPSCRRASRQSQKVGPARGPKSGFRRQFDSAG